VSEPADNGDDAVEEDPTPLQRALDLLVFAPVGIALTVAEDLPGLIGKGHQRLETDVKNARVVGRIVVAQGQRQLIERVSKLLHRGSSDDTDDASEPTAPAGGVDGALRATTALSSRPVPTPRPNADPADGVIVEGALAGYDTLSASQVVRRLESLGPDELTALQRYEASHRNRHTILNRAHQILEAIDAADVAVDVAPETSAGAPETGPPEAGAPETGPPEAGAPETAPPATTPPVATAPEPDRSVE
jgi:hypothetical protein